MVYSASDAQIPYRVYRKAKLHIAADRGSVSPLSSVLRGSGEPRATCTVCRATFELYFARRACGVAGGVALECWLSGPYPGTAIWSNAVAWTSRTLASMPCSLHSYYHRSFEPSTVHVMRGPDDGAGTTTSVWVFKLFDLRCDLLYAPARALPTASSFDIGPLEHGASNLRLHA